MDFMAFIISSHTTVFYLVYIVAQLTVPFSSHRMISLHLSEKIMGQIMSIMIIVEKYKTG